MDNFTEIALKQRKSELVTARLSIRRSLSFLTDKDSDYANNHMHLIQTYTDMINLIDMSIIKSKTSGF